MIVRTTRSAAMERYLKARGRLIPDVERHILTRRPDDRRQDVLHPSAMSHRDWCPRAAWYVISGAPAQRERPSMRLQSIFDEGHLIHDKWQRYFREMGVLYGVYACGCSNEIEGLVPTRCPDCDTVPRYREVPVTVPHWTIAGHADGWIKGIGDDALIELKSIGSGTLRIEAPELWERHGGDVEKIWKNLRRPLPSHLRQGQFYLAGLHEVRDDAPREIVFIYEFKYNQDVREFPCPYDRGPVKDMIEGAEAVTRQLLAGEPPDCPFDGCGQCKAYAA